MAEVQHESAGTPATGYFDTHAHLDDPTYDEDYEAVLQRAREAGVTKVLMPAADLASNRRILGKIRPGQGLYGALGIHPLNVDEVDDTTMDELMATIKTRPEGILAVGEIGLDYHYDGYDEALQKRRFRQQMILAHELELPVIIHCRDAFGDMMDMLLDLKEAGYLPERPAPGVFHCYSGSAEYAERLLKLGFYLGFDGPVTFKNARKSLEVLEMVPHDRVVIETDSPYLTPHPHRGKRNESSYLPLIAEKIAELWSATPQEVAKITRANAYRLFRMTPVEASGGEEA